MTTLCSFKLLWGTHKKVKLAVSTVLKINSDSREPRICVKKTETGVRIFSEHKTPQQLKLKNKEMLKCTNIKAIYINELGWRNNTDSKEWKKKKTIYNICLHGLPRQSRKLHLLFCNFQQLRALFHAQSWACHPGNFTYSSAISNSPGIFSMHNHGPDMQETSPTLL